MLPGTDIKTACEQLCEASERLGIPCHSKFNGVVLIVHPDDEPEALCTAYHRELRGDREYKIACGN